jgi:DnaJ family protein C protein 2
LHGHYFGCTFTSFLDLAPSRPAVTPSPCPSAACSPPAAETLNSTERRRQFDSVDWNIEDEVPDLKSIPADKFVDVLAPVFAREARFSKVQPVPAFGTAESSKKEVEGFYDFWYNFDSWRSFEWYDKEVNEGSDK